MALALLGFINKLIFLIKQHGFSRYAIHNPTLSGCLYCKLEMYELLYKKIMSLNIEWELNIINLIFYCLITQHANYVV